MQLPEAKAMSEWLALNIKLSESSLNLDLNLGLEINITYQSHTYRMVFMADITIILLLQPGPCWMPMEKSCYLDLENNK